MENEDCLAAEKDMGNESIKNSGCNRNPERIVPGKFRDVSDIMMVMNMGASKERAEVISKYTRVIAEFVLHRAEEICKEDKRKKISSKDIRTAIISENLFFLSDIIDLCE